MFNGISFSFIDMMKRLMGLIERRAAKEEAAYTQQTTPKRKIYGS